MRSSILYAAVVAFVIDRQFTRAACWLLAAAVLSALGLNHAYNLSAAGVEDKLGWMAAPEFFAVYLVAAVILGGPAARGGHYTRRVRQTGD